MAVLILISARSARIVAGRFAASVLRAVLRAAEPVMPWRSSLPGGHGDELAAQGRAAGDGVSGAGEGAGGAEQVVGHGGADGRLIDPRPARVARGLAASCNLVAHRPHFPSPWDTL
jgi:hypothetical protein